MRELTKRYKALCADFRIVKQSCQAIRVNTLKISNHALIKRLGAKRVNLDKVPFLKNGYWTRSYFSLGSTPEYLQGYYYIQEPASQVPSELLDAKHGELVLDMACAPGSKLTHIAQLLRDQSIVVGLDIDDKRLDAARNNCTRLGIKNYVLYNLDGRKADKLGIKFDRILLDAPCSGNYCVEPGFFRKRRVKDFSNRSELQKELLRAALKVLRPKGTLVYSTCSLEPEENEMVIDWAIREHNVRVLDTGLKVGDPGITRPFRKELSPEIRKCRRFWPHKTKTQGFFVAKLTR